MAMSMIVAMMIVAMMIVSVMVMMAVIMPVMVMMAMIMPVMVVMMMVVIVAMMMTMIMVVMMVRVLVRGRVAIVGLERRGHGLRLEAAFGEEQRDLRRVGDAQAVGEDLHRHMAVAEREDEARGPGEILLTHLEHWLDLGDDLDQPAVVEDKQVVGPQQRRVREIELDAGPLAAEHEALLLDAVLVFQQHGIDDLARRICAADGFLGAWHGMIRF
jgi:hypothetical protein